MNRQRQTVTLLGVSIDIIDTRGLIEQVVSFTKEGKQRRIMYTNTDCMLIACKNSEYREILNNADLVYADGVGVVLGARLWGYSLPGRSTAADFMPDLCYECACRQISIFFLGAKKGVADMAARCLIKKIPNLKVVGTHHGYFTDAQSLELIQRINASGAEIVLVGMGAPYQEFWINSHADKLDATVIWGVGGLFDFLSGKTRRGPQLLLDNGFEWLCRLVIEPRRLWRRYLVGNSKFVLYLLWCRFFAGNTGKS